MRFSGKSCVMLNNDIYYYEKELKKNDQKHMKAYNIKTSYIQRNHENVITFLLHLCI